MHLKKKITEINNKRNFGLISGLMSPYLTDTNSNFWQNHQYRVYGRSRKQFTIRQWLPSTLPYNKREVLKNATIVYVDLLCAVFS